jgi:hypothetical protein
VAGAVNLNHKLFRNQQETVTYTKDAKIPIKTLCTGKFFEIVSLFVLGFTAAAG